MLRLSLRYISHPVQDVRQLSANVLHGLAYLHSRKA